MDLLNKAETIDHFRDQVAKDPINTKAREGLYYFSATEIKPEPWIQNTVIVTMHPTAEAGMPHTRPPNIICLPAYYPEHLKENTLLHEYLHIDQRRRPSEWSGRFQKDGWTSFNEEIPERWLRRCRLNPDTLDQRFWSFKGYVPLPLYEREDNPKLRDVVVHWWDTKSGIKLSEPPRLFLERYGSLEQPEHPRELAAVELASKIKNTNDIDSYLDR